eukprot:6219898-Lingulodinium_polyedra.AAC.1
MARRGPRSTLGQHQTRLGVVVGLPNHPGREPKFARQGGWAPSTPVGRLCGRLSPGLRRHRLKVLVGLLDGLNGG